MDVQLKEGYIRMILYFVSGWAQADDMVIV